MRLSSLILLAGCSTFLSAIAMQGLHAQQSGEPAHIDGQREQAAAVAADTQAVPNGGRAWWDPGEGKPLARMVEYDNDHGRLRLFNTSGEIETAGHPFFEPIGSNGYRHRSFEPTPTDLFDPERMLGQFLAKSA